MSKLGKMTTCMLLLLLAVVCRASSITLQVLGKEYTIDANSTIKQVLDTIKTHQPEVHQLCTPQGDPILDLTKKVSDIWSGSSNSSGLKPFFYNFESDKGDVKMVYEALICPNDIMIDGKADGNKILHLLNLNSALYYVADLEDFDLAINSPHRPLYILDWGVQYWTVQDFYNHKHYFRANEKDFPLYKDATVYFNRIQHPIWKEESSFRLCQVGDSKHYHGMHVLVNDRRSSQIMTVCEKDTYYMLKARRDRAKMNQSDTVDNVPLSKYAPIAKKHLIGNPIMVKSAKDVEYELTEVNDNISFRGVVEAENGIVSPDKLRKKLLLDVPVDAEFTRNQNIDVKRVTNLAQTMAYCSTTGTFKFKVIQLEITSDSTTNAVDFSMCLGKSSGASIRKRLRLLNIPHIDNYFVVDEKGKKRVRELSNDELSLMFENKQIVKLEKGDEIVKEIDDDDDGNDDGDDDEEEEDEIWDEIGKEVTKSKRDMVPVIIVLIGGIVIIVTIVVWMVNK